MTNPLLREELFPDFPAIKPEHVLPAIEGRIAEGRQQLEQQLASLENPSWENLVEPLEERSDRLNNSWSPVSHLNAVMNSDELRAVYEKALSQLTQYSAELGQHQGLFRAYQALRDSAGFADLNPAQQQAVEHALRDFRLAGIALPPEQQQRFKDIKQRLSELSTQFSNNVLDATHGWSRAVLEESELGGLPQHVVAGAKRTADQEGQAGWLLTLDMPVYIAVMTHADNRQVREDIYRAYNTRASREGPTAGQWDNTELITETLKLRHELALLLGFDNYAERSIATKMAESTAQVVDFLEDLAQKSKPVAERELAELERFARVELGLEDLQAWDVAYVSEKLRQARYAISQEALRPYFPAPKVISGLFAVVERLFGVQVVEQVDIPVWHPDVQTFAIRRDGQTIAYFYFDIYARPKKRGGAWMDECRVRRQGARGLQLPVAYMVCNFSAPHDHKPSLLTHNEVTTLFHEFGHGLHHMLTDIDVAAVSGINGVEWDAVEQPSQFLENWCWEREAIPLISGHVDTGEPLPAKLLDKMLAAKNFQSAMLCVRQLEFALFDFKLHLDYDPAQPRDVQAVLDEVREQVAVVKPPRENTFQNSFSHIFAGGYAAGYYSYKWAEVLSADSFSAFEEEGIFNRETGQRFLREILSQGGSRDALSLFKKFRGREPQVDALLHHTGIQ